MTRKFVNIDTCE